METSTITPVSGIKNWLEAMIDEIIKEKESQGRNFTYMYYAPNEICYRDTQGKTLVYAVKNDCRGSYLVEFDEVEKEPVGICHVNLYKIDINKHVLENRVMHAVFEGEDRICVKAAAAKYFLMITNADAITPELLTHTADYAGVCCKVMTDRVFA